MDWNGSLLHDALESNSVKNFFEKAFINCRSRGEKIKIVQDGIDVSPTTIPSGKLNPQNKRIPVFFVSV